MGKLIDSAVIHAPAATAGDVGAQYGELIFTNLATRIPLNKILTRNGYQKISYSAGVAQVSTITFSVASTIINSRWYKVRIVKVAPSNSIPPLSSADLKQYQDETYVIQADAALLTTPLAAAFATALAAAVTAQIAAAASIFTTCVATSNAVAFTAANANQGFVIDLSDTTIATIATGTAFVPAHGSYAEVVTMNPNAVSGDTYDTHIYRWHKSVVGDVNSGGLVNQEVEVKIFILSTSSTNKTNLEAAILYYNQGLGGVATATAASVSKYAGVLDS